MYHNLKKQFEIVKHPVKWTLNYFPLLPRVASNPLHTVCFTILIIVFLDYELICNIVIQRNGAEVTECFILVRSSRDSMRAKYRSCIFLNQNINTLIWRNGVSIYIFQKMMHTIFSAPLHHLGC